MMASYIPASHNSVATQGSNRSGLVAPRPGRCSGQPDDARSASSVLMMTSQAVFAKRPNSSLEQKSLIQLHAKVDRCSLLKERKVNCFNRSRHQQWFKREIRLLLVGNLRQFHQRTIDAGECGAPCQFHCPFEFGV